MVGVATMRSGEADGLQRQSTPISAHRRAVDVAPAMGATKMGAMVHGRTQASLKGGSPARPGELAGGKVDI
jgi:hypothetical protein